LHTNGFDEISVQDGILGNRRFEFCPSFWLQDNALFVQPRAHFFGSTYGEQLSLKGRNFGIRHPLSAKHSNPSAVVESRKALAWGYSPLRTPSSQVALLMGINFNTTLIRINPLNGTLLDVLGKLIFATPLFVKVGQFCL
jgi:hypothetical protein